MTRNDEGAAAARMYFWKSFIAEKLSYYQLQNHTYYLTKSRIPDPIRYVFLTRSVTVNRFTETWCSTKLDEIRVYLTGRKKQVVAT